MTTSDKIPRRTTKKTAKSAAAADTPDTPTRSERKMMADSPGVAGIASAASAAAKPSHAKKSSRAKAPPSGATANDVAAADGAAPAGSGEIRAISVSVTSRHHEDRHASISLAAYFRSESRGFAPGHEVEDWLAAEEEVDQRLLGEGRVS